MKNTSTHIDNYKKTIVYKNDNLKSATWRPSTQKKPSNIVIFKKAYGIKTSPRIFYVKEYFYMFFSTLKDIMQAQSKTNPWIIQNIIIISLRAFQRNAFRSILMSMIAWSLFEHLEGFRRALGEHSDNTWWTLCLLRHSGTRVLGTQGTQSLEYLNTRALEQFDTQGTQALGHLWHM